MVHVRRRHSHDKMMMMMMTELVYATLKRLKPTTSAEPDNIPNVLLKSCANALSVPLSHIFDTSFKDNTLPRCWKTSIVQPVFKRDVLLIVATIGQYS